MSAAVVYKILSQSMWEEAQANGVFDGSDVDQQDGFIHFSAGDQVAETAEKHFGGQDDLVIVAVAAEALGDALRWEPSRGGALFPHLYGSLPLSAVRDVTRLPIGSDGKHELPASVRSTRQTDE